MATFNLVRNSRVFFTSNVDATTGVIPGSGASINSTNTQELQVLDGFSFTQTTQQTTVQLSEAGNTPVRGQRAFNTSLDPVDFTFSTYIRPNGSTNVSAEESVLWNALLSSSAVDLTGLSLSGVATFARGSTATNLTTFTCTAVNLSGYGINDGDVITVGTITGANAEQWNAPAKLVLTAGTMAAATGIRLEYLEQPSVAAGVSPAAAPITLKLHKGAFVGQVATTGIASRALIHSGGSNKNQLQKFGMYFVVDSIIYAVDNCVMDQVSIDFGLDGIATAAWSGKGTVLRQLAPTAVVAALPAAPAFSGTGNATGTAAARVTTGNYITNKLSTLSLSGNLYGSGGTVYTLALTGGNLTIANNVAYITPANLGAVNIPIGYFTGSRSISGNVTAYLKTGTGNSAQVLADIVSNNVAETKFRLQIEVGGASNAVHVDFRMNGCLLQVPTIEAAEVMSTTINFTAQGHSALIADNAYDLENTNDVSVIYYSV